jgi:hypothetical protein
MQVQKQPNRWSCLPTAFAIVLGIPVEKMIKELGHDGSEIIWPGLLEPYCRRSFHIQELIDFCYWRHTHVIQFQAMPTSKPPLVGMVPYPVQLKEETESRMKTLMSRKGVITGVTKSGQTHAVAWNGEMVLDPNGTTYTLNDFSVDIFWLVT